MLMNLSKGHQLVLEAIDFVQQHLNDDKAKALDFHYPVGVNPDGSTYSTASKMEPKELIGNFDEIVNLTIPQFGVIVLAARIESFLNDVARLVLLRFPQKIDRKKQISIKAIVKEKSIQAAHLKCVDSVLRTWAYAAPREAALELGGVLGIPLLELPEFHRFIELKATRDILLHNGGVANEIYCDKTTGNARARSGEPLVIDPKYFWSSFETCVRLVEQVEQQLDEQWPSPQRQSDKAETSSGPNHDSEGEVSESLGDEQDNDGPSVSSAT